MPKVKVYVTLKPTVLDAQGTTVQGALHSMGYSNVEKVRMGKYLEVDIAGNAKDIDSQVKEMCDKLLANPVIEKYRYEIVE
jgi:phosphoribosylformylglycinamidine synthase